MGIVLGKVFVEVLRSLGWERCLGAGGIVFLLVGSGGFGAVRFGPVGRMSGAGLVAGGLGGLGGGVGSLGVRHARC